ncbi:hypothetical protein ES703_52918 [subsurface metagenome]
MQRTVEYTVNNRVSPATVELLIRERRKGKTLRQLGKHTYGDSTGDVKVCTKGSSDNNLADIVGCQADLSEEDINAGSDGCLSQ